MQYACSVPTALYQVIRDLKDEVFCELLKSGNIEITEFSIGYLIHATSDQLVDEYVVDFFRQLKYSLRLFRADPLKFTLLQLQQSDPVSAYLRLQTHENLQDQERLLSMASCDANWEVGE